MASTLGKICPTVKLWHLHTRIPSLTLKKSSRLLINITQLATLPRPPVEQVVSWPTAMPQKQLINGLAQNSVLFIPIRSDPKCIKQKQELIKHNHTMIPEDKFPKPKFRRRVPKLILIQNPITWLMIKLDFAVLKNVWDSSFEEKEFKIGAKQAISRVTHVISEGRFADLSGLLTKAARLSLMRDIERRWSDKQKTMIALSNEDIQISSPRKVYFIRIAEKKYCDVDVAFLALKWATQQRSDGLVFAEIFARFHREYTPYSIPEWTIAYFKVIRFNVIRKKP